MWVLTIAFITQMRRIPFVRNLIIQYSFSLGFLLIASYAWIREAASRTGRARLTAAATFILATVFVVHFIRFNSSHVNDTIYMYNASDRYNTIIARLQAVPALATVGFSDEAFFPEYLMRQRPYEVHKCADGNEDYYVTNSTETLPAWIPARYSLFVTVLDFSIYRRTDGTRLPGHPVP
jgi:hypothetical protein